MFVSFSDPTLASTIQKLLTKQAEKEAEALRSGNISLRIHAWQRASILLPSIFCWTSCEVAPLVSTQQWTSHEVRKTTTIYLHISTANQRTKPLKFQWFSITPTAIVGTVALYMENCIAQKGKFPTQDLQIRIPFMAQSHWTLPPLYPGKIKSRSSDRKWHLLCQSPLLPSGMGLGWAWGWSAQLCREGFSGSFTSTGRGLAYTDTHLMQRLCWQSRAISPAQEL